LVEEQHDVSARWRIVGLSIKEVVIGATSLIS
jgi:hypothetical protein